MTCDRASQVHAYHDDALAPSERAALETHLGECAPCRELLADLRGLSNLFAAAPLMAMSPDVMARLNKGLRAARDRGVLRLTGWMTAVAASVLVGALLLFPESPTPNNTFIAAGEPTAWETVAVVPPAEVDETVPEVVTLATWMANDLSYAGAGGGERR
jgi:anti-sigma factor RsiW